MRLGTIWTWDDDFDLFRQRIRQSDELGFQLTGVGDVPPSYHDPYVALSVTAAEVKHGLLGPMITSPALRNPVANVTAMSALHALHSGRVVLGLGAGNSIAYGLGQKQPRQDYIRDYILALRDLFDGKPTSWEGGTIKPPRQARKVPVYYSALGPKAMRVAGEVADGVILQIGQSIETVKQSVAAVRQAAREAGRDPDEIDIWAYSIVSIATSRAEALRVISPYLACNAPVLAFSADSMARIPADLRDAVLDMQRRYDFSEHVLATGQNGKIAEELGLLEFLASIKTIAGTLEQVRAYLRELEAAGVSLLMCSMNGQEDVNRALLDFAAAGRA
jgi:5,10-methylenetetrahydromethanopterin reductase